MGNRALFNEDSLRSDVAIIWGENGAHVDVLDMLIKEAKKARELRECLKIAHAHALQMGYREQDKTDRERVQRALEM